MSQQIKAIRLQDYGGPETLHIEQIERPVPQANEVLVRVLAAGVNPIDWKISEGHARAFFPATFPLIPGRDLAGIVEEVGPGVTAFQKGQAVFGQSSQGAYTEYTVASVDKLALKPESLSFAQAAAIPVGATTAWQGLFDYGHLEAGQSVLIQGASGGVGTFAVQFAHWKGAHVLGTTSGANVEFVRSLGADQVIDYTTSQVEQAAHDVDLVYDTVGPSTLASSVQVVKPGGILVTIAGQPDQAQSEAKNVRVERFSAQVSDQLLNTFAQLVNEGKLKIAIDESYPLAQAGEAHIKSKKGHGRGRIVLEVGK